MAKLQQEDKETSKLRICCGDMSPCAKNSVHEGGMAKKKVPMVRYLIKYQENITYPIGSILRPALFFSPHADLKGNCEKNFRIMIPNMQILDKTVGCHLLRNFFKVVTRNEGRRSGRCLSLRTVLVWDCGNLGLFCNWTCCFCVENQYPFHIS